MINCIEIVTRYIWKSYLKKQRLLAFGSISPLQIIILKFFLNPFKHWKHSFQKPKKPKSHDDLVGFIKGWEVFLQML